MNDTLTVKMLLDAKASMEEYSTIQMGRVTHENNLHEGYLDRIVRPEWAGYLQSVGIAVDPDAYNPNNPVRKYNK